MNQVSAALASARARSALILAAAAILAGGVFVFAQSVSALPATTTLFSDGFESNDFSAWASVGAKWSVVGNSHHTGNYSAKALGDNSGNTYNLTAVVSTTGYQDISLDYWYRIGGGNTLAGGDTVIAQWSSDSGTTWNTADTISGSDGGGVWAERTIALPAGAANAPGFQLRFQEKLGPSESVYIDDVTLTGTAIPVSTADVYVSTSGNDSTGNGTSGAPFATIQHALSVVDSGGTVHVAAGTYDAFAVSGSSGVTITGAGAGSTIIAPTTLVSTGVGHKYTPNMLASVFVNNSTGVTIQDLTIKDNGKTPGSGGPDAILFWNASSGSIKDAAVTGTYTINGVQSGQGIAVDAGSGQTTGLTVNNVAISGFQKNGIDAVDGNSLSSNPGTITVTVQGGSIAGAGATGVIAQNGILLWNQGGGTVSGSVNGTSISNLHYTGADQDVGVYTYGTNATFSSVANVTFSNVDLYAANNSTTGAIDATSGNTFDGVAAASATPAQLGAIEDKMLGVMEDGSAGPIFLLPHTWIATVHNRGIQTGVDSAANGDTILAAPGTYATSTINVNKPVTLEGAQKGAAGANTSGTPRSGDESVIGKTLSITSSNVTVDGLSFTNPGIQVNLNNPGSSATGIVLKNNIFSGYKSVGIPTSNAGNVLVQGNYFTNPAASSEPMQFKASTTGGCNGTTVSNNVFVNATNNGGADINFSCTGTASNNITVSGNTDLGNTGGTSFAAFAGIADNLQITDNTASGISGSALYFWGGMSGSTTITGNKISTGGSSSGVSIHGDLDGSNSGTFTINGNDFSGNARGVYVAPGAVQSGAQVTAHGNDFSSDGTAGVDNEFASVTNTALAINATGNWWGNTSGPADATANDGSTPSTNPGGTGSAAIGAVAYGNWCSNSSCTAPVVTNPADGITASAATLHGTVGPLSAAQVSFWVSTSTFSTASTHMPAGVYSTPVINSVGAGAAFSDPLSIVTTNGIIWNGSSNQNVNMPAVTSGTTYYYVAWANVGGTWYPGEVQSFTTNPAAPVLATPTSGTTLQTNVFDFTWHAVTSDVGPVTYQFHSSLNPATTDGVLTTGLWTSGTLTTPMIHSTGAPDGTWYWQVRAKDGNGTWSDWSSIWSMTIDRSPVITNAADPVANTSATLNGTNGPTAASNTSFWWGTTSPSGPITSSSQFSSLSGWHHDSGLGAATSGQHFDESLTGLLPGTTYYFVAWSDVGGVWYPGAVKSFTTTGTTPVASATTNAANPVSATSATLNGTNGQIDADATSFWWGTTPIATSTLVAGANPGATEFPASGWTHDSGLPGAVAGASFSGTVTGLTTGTTYNFIAWSHVNGIWYPGGVLSFKTQLQAPTITSPVDGEATTTPTFGRVIWTPVTGTGITYTYESSLSTTTNPDGSFASPAYVSPALSTPYILTSGTPAGTYYLHVKAQDSSSNTSAWSSVVKVKVVSSSADLQGSLILVKHTTSGADGSFEFEVHGVSYSATTTLSTEGGAATGSAIALDPGTYSITEGTQSGWVLKNVSCDSGSPSSITNGESVTIQSNITTTCTFTDEPATTVTEMVYRGSLATSTSDAAAHPVKWFAYNDTTDEIDSTLGAFVTGPNPAPMGQGSIEFTLGSNPLDRQNIATYQFGGTPLSEISAMQFSAYSHSGVAGANESPFLNFNVDFNNSNTWQGRLVYVPSANMGSVPQDQWNTFDTINGGNGLWTWSHYGSNGNKWPDNNTSQYRTWNSIKTAFPNAKILASDGWLGVRVGEPGPTGYSGNVDKFEITIDDGTTSASAIADFEPDSGTATTITGVSPEPSIVGNPYTVSWNVANTNGGATPTGTVEVKVNGGTGCTAAASAGSCQITPTASGTVSLVAYFTGDAGFDGSSSIASPTPHTVNAAPSSPSSPSGGTGGGNGPVGGGLIGDLNHDGHVNFLDFALMMGMIGGSNPAGDLNNDGKVDMADLAILFAHWTF